MASFHKHTTFENFCGRFDQGILLGVTLTRVRGLFNGGQLVYDSNSTHQKKIRNDLFFN